MTGVVHGRFQVLHLKQMEYILAAKMRCQTLYIGITHPDIAAYPATSCLLYTSYREKSDRICRPFGAAGNRGADRRRYDHKTDP